MNVKQNTLAALLVLGIGMSGCNNSDNSPASQIEDKKADKNKTIPTPPVENNNTEENRTATILGYIDSQHSNHNSTITVAQLREITPALSNIDDRYLNIYQRYIASADTNISSPATVDEVQSMIYEVNDFNLPTNAILDRSFFTKTNGAFEHRFVYLPVTNPKTGRTWLNNNLGAEYANVDSSNYGASQQATAYNDHLAYGSLFQWGRKADGHELINWTGATAGTGKYGETDIKNDNPSNSLFIKQSDWRVNRDDTLWASESSENNVCPVGYRLPLNPNKANDTANEFYVETQTWSSQNHSGSMSSDLKLPTAGIRWVVGSVRYAGNQGMYWTGSIENAQYSHNLWFRNGALDANDYINSNRGRGLSVRCIKDQTPAERSASILKVIGNDHNNNKSTVTVAQLKAILPALRDINDDYQDIYQRYIASTDNNFSSPATTAEVQSMINEMNALNLPEHAILDRSFFKKTNGVFEHRFVYLPVTNSTTGRTWLNNNLGAEYANVDSSNYNASQQATTSTDYLAYGSLFQWGRKADGHELMNWTDATTGAPEYNATSTQADDPSDSLFIKQRDWRVNQDDTLWASESSANNVCPVGYRLPLNPNGAKDGENEWYQETRTWSSQDNAGALSSDLKLTAGGLRWTNGGLYYVEQDGIYWNGSVVPSDGNNSTLSDARNLDFSNSVRVNPLDTTHRGAGSSVRCIKN